MPRTNVKHPTMKESPIMAKYVTRKTTQDAKRATVQRKLTTARKYAAPPSLRDTARAIGLSTTKVVAE